MADNNFCLTENTLKKGDAFSKRSCRGAGWMPDSHKKANNRHFGDVPEKEVTAFPILLLKKVQKIATRVSLVA